jgi:enterochelin esterase-like enzyme
MVRPVAFAPASDEVSPRVDERTLTFRLADPHHALRAVGLRDDIGVGPRGPGAAVQFDKTDDGWTLTLSHPEGADRMEYLLEIEDRRGDHSTILDPANPHRAPGAFGEKSVALLPRYREPSWVGRHAPEGPVSPLTLEATGLAEPITGYLWRSPGADPDQRLPLLIVHDGPEYARLGGLRQCLEVSVAKGDLPAMRAALLAPGDRNLRYAANPAYAAALAEVVLPALERWAPATVCLGLGVSLGALSLLHAQRRHPSCFDGLLLQSGSFFTPELDAQERDFAGFGAVCEFVGRMAAEAAQIPARAVPAGISVVLTCGLREENLANNRSMADTMSRLGYAVRFVEVRDGHNYTAWRDALHPHLIDLIKRVVAERAP